MRTIKIFNASGEEMDLQFDEKASQELQDAMIAFFSSRTTAQTKEWFDSVSTQKPRD